MVVIYPNYRTIAENWSYWRLEDGSVLKSRISLIKLRARPAMEFDDIDPPEDDPENAYFLMTNMKIDVSTEGIPPENMLDTPVPKEKRWDNRSYSPEEKEKLEEVRIVNTNKGFSYYEIKFGKEKYLLLVSMENLLPRKTDLYDDVGEPIYIVDHEAAFQVIPLTSKDAPKLSVEENMHKSGEEVT